MTLTEPAALAVGSIYVVKKAFFDKLIQRPVRVTGR